MCSIPVFTLSLVSAVWPYLPKVGVDLVTSPQPVTFNQLDKNVRLSRNHCTAGLVERKEEKKDGFAHPYLISSVQTCTGSKENSIFDSSSPASSLHLLDSHSEPDRFFSLAVAIFFLHLNECLYTRPWTIQQLFIKYIAIYLQAETVS